MAEEVHKETYENFRFLTTAGLKSLSLDHLVGKTNLLRPYMHGYFVASELYDQARLIANPYVWEEERKKRVKEKAEKERASRIRSHKKVKVNQNLVDKLLKKQENREAVDTEAGLLGDSRFKKVFEDEEFRMDEALAANERVRTGGKDAVEEPNGPSENEAESDGQRPIRKLGGDVVMRASSSREKRWTQANDTALGSRIQKAGRVGKGRPATAVGERQVTFMPESTKREKQLPARPAKRSEPRRSASGNTFRKL